MPTSQNPPQNPTHPATDHDRADRGAGPQPPPERLPPPPTPGAPLHTSPALGHLATLVPNALPQTRNQDLSDIAADALDETFQTTIYAYYPLATAAIPHTPPGSSIIATRTETGLIVNKLLPDTAAT